MTLHKTNELDHLEVQESNYLCPKCLHLMFKISFKDGTVYMCSTCERVFAEKEDLDNTIQFFLRKGKFI